MADVLRSIKRGDVRTFDESYNKGFKNVWASEVDADFDLLFDAWNYGTTNIALGSIYTEALVDGAVTGAKLAANSVDSHHIVDGSVAEVDLVPTVAARLTPAYTSANQFQVITVDATGKLIWVATPPAGLVAGQVQTVHLADAPNGVTDGKITSVSWSKVTGVPAAFPPTGTAGGDLQGTYPTPTIKPTSLPWTPSGAVLTPTDVTKNLTIPGGSPYCTVQIGSTPVKTKFQHNNTQGAFALLSNWTSFGSATQDDPTVASWRLVVNPFTDGFGIDRMPVGGAGNVKNLLTLDATGQLSIPTNGANSAVIFGSRTIKNRLISRDTFDIAYLTVNGAISPAGAWTQDDSSRSMWAIEVSNVAFDAVRFNRAPPSSNTFANMFLIDSSANLTITGTTGTKAAGTTWAVPSDPRLKEDIARYARGLADILRLEPITYRLKARPEGLQCGFDAAKVREVFPECVSETRMKLAPDDEEETDGVLLFDMHPILVTLVTAIKELTARVAALES